MFKFFYALVKVMKKVFIQTEWANCILQKQKKNTPNTNKKTFTAT